MNPPTVLTIEDSSSDAELIRRSLFDIFSVHNVETLAAARLWLAQNHCDVICLDLSLPDKSGVECVEGIRQVAADIPLIVLTGDSEQRTRLHSLARGVFDFISKNEMRRLPHAVLQGYRKHLETSEQFAGITSRLDRICAALEGFVTDMTPRVTALEGSVDLVRRFVIRAAIGAVATVFTTVIVWIVGKVLS